MSVISFKRRYLERTPTKNLALRVCRLMLFHEGELDNLTSDRTKRIFRSHLRTIRHEMLEFFDNALLELEKD